MLCPIHSATTRMDSPSTDTAASAADASVLTRSARTMACFTEADLRDSRTNHSRKSNGM